MRAESPFHQHEQRNQPISLLEHSAGSQVTLQTDAASQHALRKDNEDVPKMKKTVKLARDIIADLSTQAEDFSSVESSLVVGGQKSKDNVKEFWQATRNDDDKLLIDLAETTRNLVMLNEDFNDAGAASDDLPAAAGTLASPDDAGNAADAAAVSSEEKSSVQADSSSLLAIASRSEPYDKKAPDSLAANTQNKEINKEITSVETTMEEDIRHIADSANDTLTKLHMAEQLLNQNQEALSEKGRVEPDNMKIVARMQKLMNEATEDNDRAMAGAMVFRADANQSNGMVQRLAGRGPGSLATSLDIFDPPYERLASPAGKEPCLKPTYISSRMTVTGIRECQKICNKQVGKLCIAIQTDGRNCWLLSHCEGQPGVCNHYSNQTMCAFRQATTSTTTPGAWWPGKK